MALQVTIDEREHGVFIVTPTGSIDSTTYTILDGKLAPVLAGSPTTVVFNMEGVEYISSAGVGVVFKTRKALAKKGGKLLMVHLPPKIKKVFDILNALPAEGVFGSIEELDAYLAAIQRKI
jgi:anti-anti-sigma factor